jgi:hypothetical protein
VRLANYIHSSSSDLGPRHVKQAATEALKIEELSYLWKGNDEKPRLSLGQLVERLRNTTFYDDMKPPKKEKYISCSVLGCLFLFSADSERRIHECLHTGVHEVKCVFLNCRHTFHNTQAMNVHHARHLDANTLPPPLETKFPFTLPVTNEMVPVYPISVIEELKDQLLGNVVAITFIAAARDKVPLHGASNRRDGPNPGSALGP